MGRWRVEDWFGSRFYSGACARCGENGQINRSVSPPWAGARPWPCEEVKTAPGSIRMAIGTPKAGTVRPYGVLGRRTLRWCARATRTAQQGCPRVRRRSSRGSERGPSDPKHAGASPIHPLDVLGGWAREVDRSCGCAPSPCCSQLGAALVTRSTAARRITGLGWEQHGEGAHPQDRSTSRAQPPHTSNGSIRLAPACFGPLRARSHPRDDPRRTRGHPRWAVLVAHAHRRCVW